MRKDPLTRNSNIAPSIFSTAQDFIAKAWPVQWNNIKDYSLLRDVWSWSNQTLKIAFISSVVLSVFCGIIFTYGIYLISTEVTPSLGGDFREAVVVSEIKSFNPLLSPTSEVEKKITSLLFHPLYTVTQPDYSTASTGVEPEIIPVLLAKPPEWLEFQDNTTGVPEFKTLRFTLKDNLSWSDGSKLTLDDIIYTFNLLNSDSANPQFRDILRQVQLQPVPGSQVQFDLVSANSLPQLKYLANFTPISEAYFKETNLPSISSSSKSYKPTVTSGYFTFQEGTVKDPDDPNGRDRDNPIDGDAIPREKIILVRNPNQNHNSPLFDRYIITQYESLKDIGGSRTSVEAAVKQGKVDLFARYTGINMAIPSQGAESTASILQLNQQIVPSNTYYTLFLNAKPGTPFVNTFMRKYVICSFIKNFKVSPSIESNLEIFTEEKQLLPIQLGQDTPSNCSQNPFDHLVEFNTQEGQEVYTLVQDERSGLKQVLIYGQKTQLLFVGLPDSEPLLTEVQKMFLNIGLPGDVIKDDRLNGLLNAEEKEYNAALLPITVASQDLYSLYGLGGRNISNVHSNGRLSDYNVEDNLLAYSRSNLADLTAKSNLTNFFGSEYVSANLARGYWEYNYSNRILGIKDNLPQRVTYLDDIYMYLPKWHVETRRSRK